MAACRRHRRRALRRKPRAMSGALRHVRDGQPGIVRLRSGKGFRYVDCDGAPVRDAATLQRIRALAIPPAYTDVWI